MYKETLRNIAGIGLFPAVSLLLFVAVFALVLWQVARMTRADAQRLAALPLDGDTHGLLTTREVRR
jgi:hypothetical protein